MNYSRFSCGIIYHNLRNICVVAGGRSKHRLKCVKPIEYFDFNKQKWYDINRKLGQKLQAEQIFQQTLIKIDDIDPNILYIIGHSFFNSGIFRNIECLDLRNHTLQPFKWENISVKPSFTDSTSFMDSQSLNVSAINSFI